ncbi:MAG: DUF751 family protein, partial [Cyanobacteria bacterium J06648_10]
MQEFFDNVSRYPRYLISFSLGIFFNAIEPLKPLFKKPSTAIALISAYSRYRFGPEQQTTLKNLIWR